MLYLRIGNISYDLNRLLHIYATTEERWFHNIKTRLRNIPVKYLLIGEAAPWKPNGEVSYFYNNFKGRWCQSIYRAFFPNSNIPDVEVALTNLALKGFLLIDSLPISINFTEVRNTQYYMNFVQVSIRWWLNRLYLAQLHWNRDVKVALAFKVNGREVIRCLNGILELPNCQRVKLTEGNIAANRAGYTDSGILRRIYGLM